MKAIKHVKLPSPEWQPIIDALGRDPEDCMAMSPMELEDGTIMYIYKHIDTRNYICLSEDGRAWVHDGDGGYKVADRQQCIELFLQYKDTLTQKEVEMVLP